MKMHLKNSYKVITGIIFLAALSFIIAFKAQETIAQAQNTLSAKTRAGSVHIDIRILVMGDKIEALKEIITGWHEAGE
jgi:hypothetical protein